VVLELTYQALKDPIHVFHQMSLLQAVEAVVVILVVMPHRVGQVVEVNMDQREQDPVLLVMISQHLRHKGAQVEIKYLVPQVQAEAEDQIQ